MVPRERPKPSARYSSAPSARIHAAAAKVSTLFITVGLPKSPAWAGNGGLAGPHTLGEIALAEPDGFSRSADLFADAQRERRRRIGLLERDPEVLRLGKLFQIDLVGDAFQVLENDRPLIDFELIVHDDRVRREAHREDAIVRALGNRMGMGGRRTQ